jgi:hypothetical protein
MHGQSISRCAKKIDCAPMRYKDIVEQRRQVNTKLIALLNARRPGIDEISGAGA